MKYLLILILIPLLNFSCEPARSIQGKDGVTERIVSKVKCDKPLKRYTKEVKAKLNSSLDSLKSVSNAKLEGELETKVILLSDYTSAGLDRDLMLYRLCRIFNSRGFTPEQVESMTLKMLGLWDDEIEKKNSNQR